MIVFQSRPTKTFVSPAALAVHADPDVVILEHLGKPGAGELAALVSVEDLGCPVAGKGFLQGVDTEIGAHADRHTPSERELIINNLFLSRTLELSQISSRLPKNSKVTTRFCAPAWDEGGRRFKSSRPDHQWLPFWRPSQFGCDGVG